LFSKISKIESKYHEKDTHNNPRNRQSQHTTIQPTQLPVYGRHVEFWNHLQNKILHTLIAQTYSEKVTKTSLKVQCALRLTRTVNESAILKTTSQTVISLFMDARSV